MAGDIPDRAHTLLILDPDRDRAEALADRARDFGSAVDVATALTERPRGSSYDAVAVSSRLAVETTASEYLDRDGDAGRFLIWDDVGVAEDLQDWDGVLMRPISDTAVRALAARRRPALAAVAHAQLLEASLLDGPGDGAPERLTQLAASAFAVDGCLWFSEDRVIAGGAGASDTAHSWCTLAEVARTPLYIGQATPKPPCSHRRWPRTPTPCWA